MTDDGGVTGFEIRALAPGDPIVISKSFAEIGWPGKTLGLYRRYLDEQSSGVRPVLVGLADGRFAGYATVAWTSTYRPFAAAGIPEIQDLNVLPRYRRRGLATALLDEAERLIATRGDIAGIGVGVSADYAAAHRLYLARGYLPDGRGIAYRGLPATFGDRVTVDDDLALMMTREVPSRPDLERG